MRHVDLALLAEFRYSPRCCYCGKKTPHGCEPHHIVAKGAGSASRLDIRINLAPLCTFCHRSHHDGHAPTTEELWPIVAAREGVSVERVLSQMANLRLADKSRTLCFVCGGLGCSECGQLGYRMDRPTVVVVEDDGEIEF